MLKRKRLIFAVFLAFLGFGIIFLVNFAQRKYSIPILMYHSVDPYAKKDNLLAITPASFKRQMRFLRNHNYNIVSLEEAARLIKDHKKTPARTIVITFDDGYKDNYTYAFSILKEFNIPATVFLIVNEIGRPQGDRLSLDDIRIMQESGLVTFGSHTLSHPWLPKVLSEKTLKEEIGDSKKMLEEKLGTKVNTFCYPLGGFNDKVRKIVIDSGYSCAVASNPGRRFSDQDVFALKRLRISRSAGNTFVFWLETSGYYNMIREFNHKK